MLDFMGLIIHMLNKFVDRSISVEDAPSARLSLGIQEGDLLG